MKTTWIAYISRLAGAVAVSGLLASPVLAEGLQKLGFINTERVYLESRQAQNIQTTLDKEFGERQKRLQALRQEGDELNRRIMSGSVKPAHRQQALKRLAELDRQYREKQVQLAEEYNLRRNEEFAALQQNANKVIIELAKQEGYDLIIQDAIYVQSKFDITDSVIKALNAQ